MMFFRNLLLLAVASIGVAASAPTTSRTTLMKPRSSAAVMVSRFPRGGAGPLDPDLVAKTTCAVQCLSGAFMYLAPEKVPALYKFPTSTKNVFATQQLGSAAAHYALLITSIVVYGQSLERAAAIAAVPYFVESLKGLFNGDETAKSVGVSPAVNIANLLVSGTTLYGGLHGVSWMRDYLGFLTYWLLANGIIGGVSPKLISVLWGSKETAKDALMLTQSTVLFTLAAAIVMYCILNDKSVLFGIGVSAIPMFLQCLSVLFITKEAEIFNMDKNTIYAWVAIYAITAGTLAF